MNNFYDLKEKTAERLDAASFYAEQLIQHFRNLPHSNQSAVMDQRHGLAAATAIGTLLDQAFEDYSDIFYRELSFMVSDSEAEALNELAKEWGCSRNEAATRLIQEALRNLLNPTGAH